MAEQLRKPLTRCAQAISRPRSRRWRKPPIPPANSRRRIRIRQWRRRRRVPPSRPSKASAIWPRPGSRSPRSSPVNRRPPPKVPSRQTMLVSRGQQDQQPPSDQGQESQPQGDQAQPGSNEEGQNTVGQEQMAQPGEGQPQSGEGQTTQEEAGSGQSDQGEGQPGSTSADSGSQQGQGEGTDAQPSAGHPTTGSQSEQSGSLSAGSGEGGAGTDTTTGTMVGCERRGEFRPNNGPQEGTFEEYNSGQYDSTTLGGTVDQTLDVGGQGPGQEGEVVQEGEFGPNPEGDIDAVLYRRFRSLPGDRQRCAGKRAYSTRSARRDPRLFFISGPVKLTKNRGNRV